MRSPRSWLGGMIPHFAAGLNRSFPVDVGPPAPPTIPMFSGKLARLRVGCFEQYQCSGAAM
jgi:hypothetical protein